MFFLCNLNRWNLFILLIHAKQINKLQNYYKLKLTNCIFVSKPTHTLEPANYSNWNFCLISNVNSLVLSSKNNINNNCLYFSKN